MCVRLGVWLCLASRIAAAVPSPSSEGDVTAVLHTQAGDITIRLFADHAPHHVRNFVYLATSGFYDGTLFHRVVKDFLVQGGDPQTKDPSNARIWGSGGRTDEDGKLVTLEPEFNDMHHKRGVVSMARGASPNSASSQFFIVLKDHPSLDRKYTAFGEVVSGLDVVDRVAEVSDPDPSNPNLGTPRNHIRLKSVEILQGAAVGNRSHKQEGERPDVGPGKSLPQQRNDNMQSFVGHPMSALVRQFGPPTRMKMDGRGGRVLIYDLNTFGSSRVSTYAYYVGKDGVVYHGHWATYRP